MNIKQHAETFLHNIGVGLNHEYAKIVQGFATFLEGKQAEAEAIALLQKAGYTVTEPQAVAETPAKAS